MQGIKLEPVVKTEAAPAPTSTSTDQSEAPIPTESVMNGPNLNRTVTVRRKAPLYLAPSPSPQAEEIPARKKLCVEEPLSTTIDEATRKASLPDLSVGLLTSEGLESLDFEWDCLGAAWDDRLSELADYRKIHGHCNAPANYSENFKLGYWVSKQRCQFRLHAEGKRSEMTLPRIQALESLGFEWDSLGAAWDDRLSELADYRKIHGHCNVPYKYSENSKLGYWVSKQRQQYKLHREGNTSSMTLPRIEALESLDFEWDCHGAAWDDRLSELADYRTIHGHCNVPANYSENTKLAHWVSKQRTNYKLHQEGKKSPMTTLRIQALKSVGFE
jgi:predicted chitinase